MGWGGVQFEYLRRRTLPPWADSSSSGRFEGDDLCKEAVVMLMASGAAAVSDPQ